MAMLSPVTIKECPRCKKEIKAGSSIERMGTGAGGRPLYAHKGCRPANGSVDDGYAGAEEVYGRDKSRDRIWAKGDTKAPPPVGDEHGLPGTGNAVYEGNEFGGGNGVPGGGEGGGPGEAGSAGAGDLSGTAGGESGGVEAPAPGSGFEAGGESSSESGSGGETGGDAQGEGDGEGAGDAGRGGSEKGREEPADRGRGDSEAGDGGEGDDGDGKGEENREQGKGKREHDQEKPMPNESGKGRAGDGLRDPDKDGREKGRPTPQEIQQARDMLEQIVQEAARRAGKIAQDGIEPRLVRTIAQAIEDVIEGLDAQIGSQVDQKLDDKIQGAVKSVRKKAGEALDALTQVAQQKLDEKLAQLDDVREVKYKIEVNGVENELPPGEHFHYAFPEVLKLVAAGFDVFLPGPTGCGKTHLAKQVAQALGRPFGIISGTAGTTEAEIFGTATPNITTGENVYHETDFVKTYENGGVFLLDEADALDANCFLKLNAALANGYCPVPKRYHKPVAERHPEFVCVVAANTWGTGANRMYCGRNKLDEATLDRFRGGAVPMDYDPELEKKFACPDDHLYWKLMTWREGIMAHKLQRVLSTRFCAQAHKLKKLGYDDNGIAKKLTGGWTEKEILNVIGHPVE